jgi:hypothetical protein
MVTSLRLSGQFEQGLASDTNSPLGLAGVVVGQMAKAVALAGWPRATSSTAVAASSRRSYELRKPPSST